MFIPFIFSVAVEKKEKGKVCEIKVCIMCAWPHLLKSSNSDTMIYSSITVQSMLSPGWSYSL